MYLRSRYSWVHRWVSFVDLGDARLVWIDLIGASVKFSLAMHGVWTRGFTDFGSSRNGRLLGRYLAEGRRRGCVGDSAESWRHGFDKMGDGVNNSHRVGLLLGGRGSRGRGLIGDRRWLIGCSLESLDSLHDEIFRTEESVHHFDGLILFLSVYDPVDTYLHPVIG